MHSSGLFRQICIRLLPYRIKLINFNWKRMSTPPKIVKIDLMQQSKKHRTSPPKKKQKHKIIETQQFSFSEDHPQKSSPLKSNQKHTVSTQLTKKLFNTSPNKLKCHEIHKKSPEKSKQSIDKIRDKYRKMNPNYEKIDETDRFFRKSIDKLKESFFKSDKNGKQTTKKILKQIGKYAESRSKSKKKKESNECESSKQKNQNIPIEFYGLKQNSKVIKTRSQRQQLERGTYLDFERTYEFSISGNNKQINSIDSRNESVQYLTSEDRQNRKKESYFEDHEEFKPTEKDSIGQKEIDVICQIFQFCNKCSESQKITIQDLNELIQQFERLYLIKATQKQEDAAHKRQLLPQIRFYNLLNEFEEDFRVIFYRKEANNIYDALYYLKQTNHLQLVCEDFLSIKNSLQL